MQIIKGVGLVVGGVIVGLLVALVLNGKPTVGSLANCSAGYTCYTYLNVLNDLVVDGATTLTGAVGITGDLTVSGGTLTVTTSNTATSTITGGCFQFYATSTATAHKFQASTTPGIMYSQYGTCPNL